ncbi:MAG: hypothetical protein AAB431_01805 [Patescibacteria group bacterium]
MRPFLTTLLLLTAGSCAPVDITRDANDPLRTDLERLLNESGSPREHKSRCKLIPKLRELDRVRKPGRNAPAEPEPELIPKAWPSDTPEIFDGKLDPNGEIPTKDFDPETTLPNTGFQFKTGEVDPPPPSLQEMTQLGCSKGERVLRNVYTREVEDIWLDFETQMDDARRKPDGEAILSASRLALSDRDAALDEARKNYLWKLDQIHKNCHRTLH